MLNLLLFALISQQQASSQQIIWIGDPNITNVSLKASSVSAVIFTDNNNVVRLIILNPTIVPPGPSPPPPGPSPPPAPPDVIIPVGKYNISPSLYKTIKQAISAGKVTKDQAASLAKAYHLSQDNINAAIAGVGTLTKTDAQNILINKTHEALGTNLQAWVPILDTIVIHMKSISPNLPTSKELAEYYGECAIAFEHQ